MEAVVDTSVIIGFLRNHSPEADAFEMLLNHHQVYLTSVTIFELEVGLSSRSAQADVVEMLVTGMPTLALDLESARRAAREDRRLRQEGRPIGIADVLIAGICLSHGKAVVTNNVDHFARIPDLQVRSPQDILSLGA